ncbi:lipase 1-like [Manduca sexta]|uniref:lipase 1-like n=1 Tax=Manduca sexta TaxID=7130 RepID=UPI001182F5C6|nr:lipase 1-like [Manduca sexta]
MVALNTNRTEKLMKPYSIQEKRYLKAEAGFDEDTYLNFDELANKYDYSSEEHSVVTEDGYILKIFRIIPKCETNGRYPVLLMHGILDSSDAWILAGTELGIGFILARNCYDVWAANHRGNSYSRRHVRLDPNFDPEFWDYTFDEHGNYDLPAIIDHILQNTTQPKLNYVAHSQGTTDFFVLNSLRPEYNDKISLAIQLAPVAWMKHIKSPISVVVAERTTLLKRLLDAIGLRELFAKNHLIHFVTEILCQVAPEPICGQVLSLTVGYKQGSVNARTLSVAFGHLLNGISSKDAAHFGQLVTSGHFQRYDEGKEGNIRRYGRSKPPKYNVTLVTAPVVLFTAKNDWVSSQKDVGILMSKLPNVVENYVIPLSYWSHHNYLWDPQAAVYVFPKILDYLNKFNPIT